MAAPSTATPLAPVQTAEAQPALRACLVLLAGSVFAVDVTSAREVAVFDEITPVPRAPLSLLGVANLRGAVMPIVDIRPLLGLPAQRAGRSLRALVLRDGAVQAAAAVDAVVGLEPFEEIVAPEPNAGSGEPSGRQGFAGGRLRWNGGLITLLDVAAILGALRLEMRGATPARGEPA